MPNDPVDEANDESFPASDPPAWTGTHAGSPEHTMRAVRLHRYGGPEVLELEESCARGTSSSASTRPA